MSVASGAISEDVARAGEHAREDVAAVRVGAERMTPGRRLARRELVVEDRVVRRRRDRGRARRRSRTRSRRADRRRSASGASRRSRSERAVARLGARRARGVGVARERAHSSAAEADARVEERVEDVGDQRHDEVDDPDHEDARGQQREVLLPRGLEDQRADPLVVEEVLDGDEARRRGSRSGRRRPRSSAGSALRSTCLRTTTPDGSPLR